MNGMATPSKKDIHPRHDQLKSKQLSPRHESTVHLDQDSPLLCMAETGHALPSTASTSRTQPMRRIPIAGPQGRQRRMFGGPRPLAFPRNLGPRTKPTSDLYASPQNAVATGTSDDFLQQSSAPTITNTTAPLESAQPWLPESNGGTATMGQISDPMSSISVPPSTALAFGGVTRTSPQQQQQQQHAPPPLATPPLRTLTPAPILHTSVTTASDMPADHDPALVQLAQRQLIFDAYDINERYQVDQNLASYFRRTSLFSVILLLLLAGAGALVFVAVERVKKRYGFIIDRISKVQARRGATNTNILAVLTAPQQSGGGGRNASLVWTPQNPLGSTVDPADPGHTGTTVNASPLWLALAFEYPILGMRFPNRAFPQAILYAYTNRHAVKRMLPCLSEATLEEWQRSFGAEFSDNADAMGITAAGYSPWTGIQTFPGAVNAPYPNTCGFYPGLFSALVDPASGKSMNIPNIPPSYSPLDGNNYSEETLFEMIYQQSLTCDFNADTDSGSLSCNATQIVCHVLFNQHMCGTVAPGYNKEVMQWKYFVPGCAFPQGSDMLLRLQQAYLLQNLNIALPTSAPSQWQPEFSQGVQYADTNSTFISGASDPQARAWNIYLQLLAPPPVGGQFAFGLNPNSQMVLNQLQANPSLSPAAAALFHVCDNVDSICQEMCGTTAYADHSDTDRDYVKQSMVQQASTWSMTAGMALGAVATLADPLAGIAFTVAGGALGGVFGAFKGRHDALDQVSNYDRMQKCQSARVNCQLSCSPNAYCPSCGNIYPQNYADPLGGGANPNFLGNCTIS